MAVRGRSFPSRGVTINRGVKFGIYYPSQRLLPGGDSYLSSTKLLMGFEGVDGATGAPGFTDESPAAHGTATIAGDGQIDTAQSKFGTSSFLCDGSGDYAQFAASADWDLGTIFTIETYVRFNALTSDKVLIGNYVSTPTGFMLETQSSAELSFFWRNSGQIYAPTSAASVFTTGQWYALAVDGDGTKVRMYLDGVMIASETPSPFVNVGAAGVALTVGADSLGGRTFNGWLDEVRITKGVARYASDSGYVVLNAAFPRTNTGAVVDTDTFFAPTLTPEQALTPGLIIDTDTFFAPTIAITDQTLVPPLFSDTDTFFAPTITTGSVTLTAALFSDTDTFFAPAVSAGDVTLTPSLVTDADTFFAPTASASYTLTTALFSDTDTFFAPTVEAQGNINPSFVTDTDTFFAPTVVPGAVSALPGLVADTDTIYAPTADNRYSLLPALFNDADTFFAPTQSNVAYVLPGLVTEADVIYAINAPNTSTLSPPFIDSDVVIYSPTVTTPFTLVPSLFTDTDALFSPTLLPGPVSIFPPRVIDLDIFLTPNVGIVKKGGQGGGGTGGTVTTDLKYASQVTMTESGLIYALEVEASTAKVINTRMLIYADTGANLPGALLGQSTVKTSVVVGANNYPLLVPVSRTIGQKIWIALHSDGSFNWFLVSSPGGAKYNTDLFSDGPSDPYGPVSNDNKKAPVFVLYLTAANAGMTAGLVTDTDTFYAPSISGSKTLTAPFLTDADFFLSPIVLPVNVLTPSLVTDDDAIYAPAAARSALLPDIVTDNDTFYSPFVGAHAPTVFGADMPSDDQIYQATVTSFGAGLPPSLFSDDDTFFAPTVVSAYPMLLALHEDTDTFHVATVAPGEVTLQPPLLSAGEDFWDPVVSRLLGTTEALPSLFVDDDTFYSPVQVAHKSGRRQVYLDGRNDSNKSLDTVE